MHSRSTRMYDHIPSHPQTAGTEHVGFSPTRQTLLTSSAKSREVFGESHWVGGGYTFVRARFKLEDVD